MTWRDELDPNIRILSCDAQDRLSDDTQGPDIVNWLHAQQPTVAVVHRAYRADAPGALDGTVQTLRGLQYSVLHQVQDTDGNPEAHGILMFVKRKAEVGLHVVPLAGRYALLADMYDTRTRRSYKVVGYTGDGESEERRLNDITVLRQQLKYAGDRHPSPTVLATDARTLRRRGLGSQLLYAKALLTRPWPTVSTAEREYSSGPIGWLERRMRAGHTLATMATGRAYAAYIDANRGLGLKNADASMKSTGYLAGLPVKLHHIFVSPDVVVKSHHVPPPKADGAERLDAHSVDARTLLAVLQLQFDHVWR